MVVGSAAWFKILHPPLHSKSTEGEKCSKPCENQHPGPYFPNVNAQSPRSLATYAMSLLLAPPTIARRTYRFCLAVAAPSLIEASNAVQWRTSGN
jgi:hypothetical protein